jgi:hypothetical protein
MVAKKLPILGDQSPCRQKAARGPDAAPCEMDSAWFVPRLPTAREAFAAGKRWLWTKYGVSGNWRDHFDGLSPECLWRQVMIEWRANRT